jgi:hypothetical protein
MGWTKASVVLVPLLGLCCFGQTSSNAAANRSTTVDPGYSIMVAPPADPIRLGSPINVTVTVKNISEREIYWRSEFSDTAYRAFSVLLMKNGSEVETTSFGRKVRGQQRPGDPPDVEGGGSILSSVAPGKSFSLTLDLKRLYEITEPGLYTLDVSRMEDGNAANVRAKTLTLKVVP